MASMAPMLSIEDSTRGSFLRQKLPIYSAASLAGGLIVWLAINLLASEQALSTSLLMSSAGIIISGASFAFAERLHSSTNISTDRATQHFNDVETAITDWKDHSDSLPVVDTAGHYATLFAPLVRDLAVLPKLIEIADSHLRDANEGTENSALQVLNALGSVRVQSAALLDELRAQQQRAGQFAGSQDPRLEQNAQTLRNLANYQTRRSDQQTEDAGRIDEVLERVKGLSELTQMISKIAGRTNLLALNATIEAARAGDAGRSFAIVADEVRNLSQQAHTATSRIDAEIVSVTKLVKEKLSAIVDPTRVAEEKKQIHAITDALTDANGAFEEVTSYLSSISGSTGNAMEKVHEDVVTALGYLQLQDVSRQLVEHVQKVHAELDAHFISVAQALDMVDLAKEPEWMPLSDRMASLRESHVMQSQRIAHDQALGQKSDEEDRPLIELF